MRSLGTITLLFLLLILVPGAILAWLGWRSTASAEDQAMSLARQQSERAADKTREIFDQNVAKITGDLQRAASTGTSGMGVRARPHRPRRRSDKRSESSCLP